MRFTHNLAMQLLAGVFGGMAGPAISAFAQAPADRSLSEMRSGAYSISGKVTLSAGRMCQFVPGTTVSGVLDYPGAGKAGPVLFLGSAEQAARPVLRQLARFPAVPQAGLNGWSGAAPAQVTALTYADRNLVAGEMRGGVSFALNADATRPADALRGRIRISDTSGCTETYDATLVRFGRFVAVED